MIKLSVRSDIENAIKALDDIQKKHVPFATAKALTKTAQDVQAELSRQVSKDLENPVRFTVNAFRIEPARKRARPYAIVAIKDIQDEYLRLNIFGGTEIPKKRALLKPMNIRLNQHGNLPKNKVKRLLARDDVFSGTVGGIGGIWQRLGKNGKAKQKLKLLIRYKSEQNVKPVFKFFETAEKTAKHVFPGNIESAFREALQTAK